MKIAIIYYSKTGNTREMGSVIAEGIERAGVIIGTPTWVANTCWQIKKWFDVDSRELNLAGKLGGVYATAHYAQGGADVALLTMIGQRMVKGMVLYSGGASLGKPFIHLGPVALDSVGTHFEDCKEDFRIYGERFAKKAGELFEI